MVETTVRQSVSKNEKLLPSVFSIKIRKQENKKENK